MGASDDEFLTMLEYFFNLNIVSDFIAIVIHSCSYPKEKKNFEVFWINTI